MKVECENLSEREVTPELIRELIRDDARRGEFMILMQDADEETFVQIAGDYDDVGGVNDGCFDLEEPSGACPPFIMQGNTYGKDYRESLRFFPRYVCRVCRRDFCAYRRRRGFCLEFDSVAA